MNCRTIASYASCAEAERAVDHLSGQGFPIERVSIIGRDLYFAARETEHVGYAEAVLRGALAGALAGASIAWLFGVFDWFDPLLGVGWIAFRGLWFGGLVGALVGLATQAAMRSRHVAEMRADHCEVVVDDEVARTAACLLASREEDVTGWSPPRRAASQAPAPPAAAPARR